MKAPTYQVFQPRASLKNNLFESSSNFVHSTTSGKAVNELNFHANQCGLFMCTDTAEAMPDSIACTNTG